MPTSLATVDSDPRIHHITDRNRANSDGVMPSGLKVAVVYDSLFTYAGAERVLESILRLYPSADLYAIVDVLPKAQRAWLKGRKVHTTYLQRWPLVRKYFRSYAWAMPGALESLDLSRYDLIVSCVYAFANGIVTHPGQAHLSYLTARPLKYLYDEKGDFVRPPLVAIKAALASQLRVWSSIASHRPDQTLAISQYVAEWMENRHKMQTEVLYPPVDVSFFSNYARADKDDYYVTVSRLQSYKKVEVLIEAFNQMGKRLLVVGSGPQEKHLRAMARSNIEFVGYRRKEEIAELVSKAKAFVFASREDFGISMVEAQACGTPVIAYGSAGAVEINRDLDGNPLGALFERQEAASVISAVEKFEQGFAVTSEELVSNARRFCRNTFESGLAQHIDMLVAQRGVKQRSARG
jgi:glycosyltransferase involved in cell wall biosynthesis